MTKVLVVLTNTASYAGTDEATGLWLAEATEFISEMEKAGIAVDYVSPKGGYVPIDPRSLKKFYVDDDVMKNYQNPDFQLRALSQSLKPEQVNPDDYRAIYYTGGHGVVWDFPENAELQAISQAIYQKGGYVTSVCHGLAGLLNIKASNGDYLIKGKNVTGFTQTEEILSGKNRLVPFGTEKEARNRGANFQKKRAFASFAVADQRIITGQNPMSGRQVGQLLVRHLKK